MSESLIDLCRPGGLMYPDPRIRSGGAMMPGSEHQRTGRHAALINAGVGMQAHDQCGHVARCRHQTAATIKPNFCS